MDPSETSMMLPGGEDTEMSMTGMMPSTSSFYKMCDTLLSAYTVALGLVSVVDLTGTTAVSANQYSILLWTWVAASWLWVFFLYFDGHCKCSRAKPGQGMMDYASIVRPLICNAFMCSFVSIITASMTQALLNNWSAAQLVYLEQRNTNPWPAQADQRVFLNFALIEILVIFGMFHTLKHAGWMLWACCVPEMMMSKGWTGMGSAMKTTQGKKKPLKKMMKNSTYGV